MKFEVKPFTEEMLPAAGGLLARRHKRNRASFPLLPDRFAEIQVAEAAVRLSWQGKFKRGYAAFRNGTMIAYLIGEQVTQPWGRCGYVHLPDYALVDGESAAVLQDLYARLGDDWVRLGVFSHGLYVSAADVDVVQAWFDIGFGKERVDAMLDLRTLDIPKVDDPAGVTIRRAGKDDNEYLGNLSHLIVEALSNPPYWHPTIPEDYPELREGWSELADDAEWKVWLALEDGEVLGCAGFVEKKVNDADMLAAPRLFTSALPPQRHRRANAESPTSSHGADWKKPEATGSRFATPIGLAQIFSRPVTGPASASRMSAIASRSGLTR